LHSSGGDLDAAVHLTEILRSYSDNLNFIVPRFAKSAATLVALSGNSLILDKPSELGPLDPVWMGDEEDYSPLALPKTIEFLNDLEKKLPKDSKIIKIIAEGLSVERMGVYKASLDNAVEPLTDLLATGMFNGKSNGRNLARKIAQRLTSGYPQHGYPVTLGEAQKLGIRVTRLPPDEWLLVWRTYKCFEETYLR